MNVFGSFPKVAKGDPAKGDYMAHIGCPTECNSGIRKGDIWKTPIASRVALPSTVQVASFVGMIIFATQTMWDVRRCE